MTFIKNLFKKKEEKLVTNPYVIKGKQMTIILNNGGIYTETIKDNVGFHKYLQANIVLDDYQYILRNRLTGDSICVNDVHSQILIPKTSINRTEIGPEINFETVEIYSHYE